MEIGNLVRSKVSIEGCYRYGNEYIVIDYDADLKLVTVIGDNQEPVSNFENRFTITCSSVPFNPEKMNVSYGIIYRENKQGVSSIRMVSGIWVGYLERSKQIIEINEKTCLMVKY